MDLKIIGIAGLPRSGKDTVAEQFIADGWFGVSTGDIVREQSKIRHKSDPDPISVANMTETANYMRQTGGADVVLKESLRQFEAELAKGKEYKGLVLWSIRAPIEADFILNRDGELVWIEASDEVRLQRNNANLRPGEIPKTLTEFKRHEDLQWQPRPDLPKESQMDVSYVKSKATKIIHNNGTDKQEFLNRIDILVNQTPLA